MKYQNDLRTLCHFGLVLSDSIWRLFHNLRSRSHIFLECPGISSTQGWFPNLLDRSSQSFLPGAVQLAPRDFDYLRLKSHRNMAARKSCQHNNAKTHQNFLDFIDPYRDLEFGKK